MKKLQCSILFLLFMVGTLLPARLSASVEYDDQIPQLAFAAQEVEIAMKEAGQEDLEVALLIRPDETSPESFKIRHMGPDEVWIIGSDASGAMYGGLELADLLRLGLPIEEKDHEPFVKKRGIKYNIPWDARTPSYDDTGDAAQKNIATIYDFEYWKAFFDDMARYRYNVLSLWGNHPYPSITKLEDYPDVALDDVYRIAEGVFKPEQRNKLQDIDIHEPGVLELVKKISIDDKIEHWQKVFDYAGDRGVEVYIFHWNVFTFGATGKYGITQQQHNDITIDYMRKSVRQALLTYPQIAGIGVTAGENADNHMEGKYSIENFLFNTYGRGMMDVMEEQPDRKFRFIFRQHMTGLGPITEAFSDFPGEFNTSFKYAIGHMYTMRRPLLFERSFRDQVEEYKVPVFFNLRNDDMFVLRWGNPDYVREYIQKMPHNLSPGFYMGSDGYVWGREHIAKNPETAGRLEIDKHWYRFRQWGQLAYNPMLGRDYWEATLKHRFPGIDAAQLYDAWASTSEIIPHLNTICYKPNDNMIAPEGCMDRRGFLTLDEYFFQNWNEPMYGSGWHSVVDWGKAAAAGEELEGVTPMVVADKMDAFAATAMETLSALRNQAGGNVELEETLNDIESMAYLGRYYADKLRAGSKLAAFRADVSQKNFHKEAIEHLEASVEEWKAYTAIVSAQYKPQLMQRTSYMDWEKILVEVEKEILTLQEEGDYPKVRFVKLKEGDRLPAGSGLLIEVKATDKDGISELKLYMNGLRMKAEKADPKVWSGSSDELLLALESGVYHLEAIAEDNNGISARQEIKIAVGDVPVTSSEDWREEIHQIVLNEGEHLGDKEFREFPRLECYLYLNDDGRLVLYNGTPGNPKERIWQPSMHRDYWDPQYATLENGQLVIYRGTPDHQEAKLYESPPVSGNGPFNLGITLSKKLVIYREVAGEEGENVWISH